MSGKLPISVAVVCQDEEDRIRETLASVGFAAEIVVVDSGSKDRTLEIVREFTDKIHHRPWKGWKDQKRWAADQCENEWVFTLDADEVVSGELAVSIRAVFEKGDVPENGFTMNRRTFYLGRWIKRGGWYPDRKLRIYRKSKAEFGGDDPHEVISAPAPVGHLNGDLLHYTYRDFPHHARQMIRYGMVNAEAKARHGGKAGFAQVALHPPYAFFKSYLLKLGFLDGVPGLIVAAMNGYYTFVKYARLWEMGREKKDQ